MAVLWLTQSAIVTLNILLGILFVLANKDFCGSVFETRVGILQQQKNKTKQKRKKEKKRFLYSLCIAGGYKKERFFAFQTMPW